MRHRLAVVATMIVIAACSSSTAPPLVVTLSGPSTVQGFDTTIDGAASYGCHYLLTAEASTGGVHEYITWQGGHYHYVRQDGDTLSGQYQGAFGPVRRSVGYSRGRQCKRYARQFLDDAFPVLRGALLLEGDGSEPR